MTTSILVIVCAPTEFSKLLPALSGVSVATMSPDSPSFAFPDGASHAKGSDNPPIVDPMVLSFRFFRSSSLLAFCALLFCLSSHVIPSLGMLALQLMLLVSPWLAHWASEALGSHALGRRSPFALVLVSTVAFELAAGLNFLAAVPQMVPRLRPFRCTSPPLLSEDCAVALGGSGSAPLALGLRPARPQVELKL